MLRHAAGYALAGRGIDTRALQAFMGHRSIANTVVHTDKHEAVPQCGSLCVTRMIGPACTSIGMTYRAAGSTPKTPDREIALEKAKAVAMAAEGSR
jgi:hypothetical protein